MNDIQAGGSGQQNSKSTLAEWLARHEPGPGDDRSDDDRRRTDRRFGEWQCSVCGHPLAAHTVDHRSEHTVFACPVSAEGDVPVDEGPLGETGQTKL